MTDAPAVSARNPRAEADACLADGSSALVLEPSPPFDDRDPDYLADDPVDSSGLGGAVVAPVGANGRSWEEVVAERPDLADFASDRWLTSGRQLARPVPAGYHEGRVALHRLAVYVLSPARVHAIGKMALRRTHHGFGTPFFGPDDRQLRVQDGQLVDQRGDTAVVHDITTLAAAAEALEVELDLSTAERFDIPEPGPIDDPLSLMPDATAFLADWYGFANRVLETVRSEIGSDDAPSRVQLWAEHFDAAFDAGDESAGRRAGFGASPGDHHDGGDPEPYLWVGPWAKDGLAEHAFWNVDFGAKLPFAELVAAQDHEAAAAEFFRTGRRLLAR
jgi:hypothetical protein